ncbi:hypothetical protein BKG85_05110 [Mycobacteroides chelonae]|nr:hypothetical protein BKG85_05110 [Mycobacteroides chelonae]
MGRPAGYPCKAILRMAFDRFWLPDSTAVEIFFEYCHQRSFYGHTSVFSSFSAHADDGTLACGTDIANVEQA